MKRTLTDRENSWINDILPAHKDWADVSIGELNGCEERLGMNYTIWLDAPVNPHNPRLRGRAGHIGVLFVLTDLKDKRASRNHMVTVSLFFHDGWLSRLDVIWDDDTPMPTNWNEVSRRVHIFGT
jgi:hypothetical protein